jgi:hypothetical protein
MDTSIEKQLLTRFSPVFAYISGEYRQKGKKAQAPRVPGLFYFNRGQTENLSLETIFIYLYGLDLSTS